MNNKWLLIGGLLLSLNALALPKCPNITWMEQTIYKPHMEKTSYRNPLNRLITWLPSYHMVHDVITAENKPAEIVAKFDYGKVIHKDLENENVQFFYLSQDDNNWHYLGQSVTDSDGKAKVTLPMLPAGQYRVFAGVPADGSGSEGFVTVIQPGTQAVLFDIDGTLTQSDLEQIGDYTGIDLATPKIGAYELVTHYLDLGYQPIYLTARVYWYTKGTRRWLNWMGLPEGFLRTSLDNNTSLLRTAQFKIDEIKKLEAQGLNIIRAYGNAKTDAEAFIGAGLTSKNSFTIGKYAGYFGTTPILHDNYLEHIKEEVSTYPAANCN